MEAFKQVTSAHCQVQYMIKSTIKLQKSSYFDWKLQFESGEWAELFLESLRKPLNTWADDICNEPCEK